MAVSRMLVFAAYRVVGHKGTVEAGLCGIRCRALCARYDADALCIEFFPRARAHATGNDDVHAAFRQKLDQVMVVTGALDALAVRDFSVFGRKDIKVGAMPEMPGNV